MHPLITLTTDFGTSSPYVAAMKGVILSINPSASIVDLTHNIPPQNLVQTAFFLAQSIPHFPAGSIHVVVVDPGVGTDRALLLIEAGNQRILVPDNGCCTMLLLDTPEVFVRRVTNSNYWRSKVSSTFHGRDILAPVAAHLSMGVKADNVGPVVKGWRRLDLPVACIEADQIVGEVVFVDHFGNLITNIPGDWLPVSNIRVRVGECEVSRRVKTYSEAPVGTPAVLVSSAGTLEIAVNQGNAARQLGAAIGSTILVKKL